MSGIEWIILGYLAVRLIEVLDQAWANWCQMKVHLNKKDNDDEKPCGF